MRIHRRDNTESIIPQEIERDVRDIIGHPDLAIYIPMPREMRYHPISDKMPRCSLTPKIKYQFKGIRQVAVYEFVGVEDWLDQGGE